MADPSLSAVFPTVIQLKDQSKSVITSTDERIILLRCALRALLTHLTNLRQFLVNNAASLPVGNPPNVPSWQQTINIIKNLIDNESDPNT